MFLFVSFRCCSPGKASDWSTDYSTETVHAQPDKSRRLRPEHHQRSCLCLWVLVLRDGWHISTRVLRHPLSTLHTLVLLHQCMDQCLGFNVVFDYSWQFLRWKAMSCLWWECYTLFWWQAQPDVYSHASGIMELNMETLYVIETSLRIQTSRTFLNWKCMHLERSSKDMMIHQYSFHDIIRLCLCNIHFSFLTVCIGWGIFFLWNKHYFSYSICFCISSQKHLKTSIWISYWIYTNGLKTIIIFM